LGDANKSIIVVADTHFGHAKQGEACDPQAFSDFLKWIKELEKRGAGEPLIPSSLTSTFPEMKNRVFRPPEEIVFLGDFLELWDAPSKSVDFSTRYIINLLSELNCKKTYVLGNHDHELADISRNYPLGDSEIEFQKEKHTSSKGNEEYLFVHGHQFDKLFEWPTWKWMTPIRNVAAALGSYSLIFLILFAISAVFLFGVGPIARLPAGMADWILLVLLGSLGVPYLFYGYGRKLWNRGKSIKYDFNAAREKAPEFITRKYGSGKINVVYGHTHAIDFYKDESGRMIFMNLPGWVRIHPSDSKYSKYTAKLSPGAAKKLAYSVEHELYHAFLYIDEEGSEFFGWHDVEKRPYWIPKWLIKKWRMHTEETTNVTSFSDDIKSEFKGLDVEKTLLELGWVKEVVKQWFKGPSETWERLMAKQPKKMTNG